MSAITDRSAPGEHASCGPKLQPSGFTYEPSDLMKHKIYHYNFGWRDFGDTSMTNLLDMVKVQSNNQIINAPVNTAFLQLSHCQME